MLVKKRVDPKKIFFKYKCNLCKTIIEQPISEAHEVGEPWCPNCDSADIDYISTFMIVKKDPQITKKIRTKMKPLSKLEHNKTQILSKKEKTIKR